MNRAGARIGHDGVLTRDIDGVLMAEIRESCLDCGDAIWHFDQGFDIFVGQQDHGRRLS